MLVARRWALPAAVLVAAAALPAEEASFHFTRELDRCRVTLLSTTLARRGVVGEWGFAALVETDTETVLFDTGGSPDTVVRNAEHIGVDLRGVRRIVLSHGHNDHTGGLLAVTRLVAPRVGTGVPVHAHPDAFGERYISLPGTALSIGEEIGLPHKRATLESLGARFVLNTGFVEIAPGVALTGEIPATNPFERPSSSFTVKGPGGAVVPDPFRDDQALVLNTKSGLVILSGCGHAGIVNTLDAVRSRLPGARLRALIGGFHVQFSPDDVVNDVARRFAAYGIDTVVGAHCTGIEPIFRFRSAMAADQQRVFVGSVGTVYDLH